MRLWGLALVIAWAWFAAPEAKADTLPEGEWVEITPEPARIDGRTIEATCSGAPGADPAYRFWVRRGASENLVIFFDGGGACWDDITCSVPWLASGRPDDGFYKAEILPTDNPNRFGGMFEMNNPDNPLRDWTFVFVPYCTGDVHLGSNTARYRDADTGDEFTIEHRGADNFRVVLDWARNALESPPRLLVTGSSAGAYGAVSHYVRIRDAFPRAQAMMLGDAGQGVTTPEFSATSNESWRVEAPAALFGRRADASAVDDIVARLAAHYPNDRFAQVTTARDRTQAGFYALMGMPNACRAWSEKMVRDLSARQAAANFRSYVAEGDAHTILRARRFYTEASGGAPFLDWLRGLLSVDGAGWNNYACEECLAPPAPCQF